MLTGRKLALTLAFTVLVALAFGVSCRGFFQPNTLETVTLQPPSLNIGVGLTQQFTAYGTYSDNSRSQITSGIVWTTSDPVDVPITAQGLLTAANVTSDVTITGSAQGLSGTATVSVIGDVTNMTVSPTTETMTEGTVYNFTFTGSPGPPDFITTNNGGTLTITATNTQFNNYLTCSVGADTNGNPVEACVMDSGAVAGNPYTIQMTYPTTSGGTVTATATVNASGS
jgi:hypothetical protein